MRPRPTASIVLRRVTSGLSPLSLVSFHHPFHTIISNSLSYLCCSCPALVSPVTNSPPPSRLSSLIDSFSSCFLSVLSSLACLYSHCIHQILESVSHIHHHDIVHRDLKVSMGSALAPCMCHVILACFVPPICVSDCLEPYVWNLRYVSALDGCFHTWFDRLV